MPILLLYLIMQASASSFGKRLLSLKDAALNSRRLMSTDSAQTVDSTNSADKAEWGPGGGSWANAGASGFGGMSNAFAQVRQEQLSVRGLVVWQRSGRTKSVSAGVRVSVFWCSLICAGKAAAHQVLS
jgi:hypothetical protein